MDHALFRTEKGAVGEIHIQANPVHFPVALTETIFAGQIGQSDYDAPDVAAQPAAHAAQTAHARPAVSWRERAQHGEQEYG